MLLLKRQLRNDIIPKKFFCQQQMEAIRLTDMIQHLRWAGANRGTTR